MNRSLALFVGAVLALSACTKDNPAYCDVGDGRCSAGTVCDPDVHRCVDDCTTTGCAAPAVCAPSGYCSECSPTDAAVCVAFEPVCGADFSCRACAAHAECADGVCLPDGTCATAADVAYLAADGGGSSCTRTSPCNTLGAASLLWHPIIYAAPGTYFDSTKWTLIRDVMLLAEPGALTQFVQTGAGPAVELGNNGRLSAWHVDFLHTIANVSIVISNSASAVLELHDSKVYQAPGLGHGITLTSGTLHMTGGELTDVGGTALLLGAGSSATLDGVTVARNGRGIAGDGGLSLLGCRVTDNAGDALAVGGMMAIVATTIADNAGRAVNAFGTPQLTIERSTVATNAGGGLFVSGPARVVNNFIHHNGSPTSALGAAYFENSGASAVVAFNTVLFNRSDGTRSPGLECGAVLVPQGNIIAANSIGTGAPTMMDQHRCAVTTSHVAADATTLAFVSTTPPFDYHLTNDSPGTVRGAAGATCPTSVVTDFDNEPRPQGACDLGADEVP